MELTRKKEMTWVSYAVHQEIQNLPDLPNEEKEKVYFYVNYRIKNSFRLSRAYFTWKMYHYMMGCSIPDIQLVRIAFLAELVTCITYMQ
ncbi:MAG: hypothetical protein KDC84_16085, partial [Crocinitomicaceae bacterium]|nr:hypothetical protein [Crocinitomicaceae bacterium]